MNGNEFEKEGNHQRRIKHDLNNKIQIIQGYLELLEDERLSADAKKFIEKSMRAVKDSRKLLDKLGE